MTKTLKSNLMSRYPEARNVAEGGGEVPREVDIRPLLHRAVVRSRVSDMDPMVAIY